MPAGSGSAVTIKTSYFWRPMPEVVAGLGVISEGRRARYLPMKLRGAGGKCDETRAVVCCWRGRVLSRTPFCGVARECKALLIEESDWG
jgi:hypothetical protein